MPPDIPAFDPQLDVHQAGTAEVSPEAVSAPGRAIAAAGAVGADTEQEFLRHYAQAKMASDASNTMTGLTPKLQDIQFKWSKVPDRAAAAAGYNADVAALRKSAVENIGNPFLQTYVAREFDDQSLRREQDTKDAAFQLEADKHKGDLRTNLTTLGQAAAAATSDETRAAIIDQGHAAIAGAEAGGWINGDEAAEQKLQFGSTVQAGVINQQINEALMHRDAKRMEALGIAVNDPKSYPGLLQPERELLDRRIINSGFKLEHYQEMAEAHAQARVREQYMDNLQSLQANGEPVHPLSDGEVRSAFPDDAPEMLRSLHLAQGMYRAGQATAMTSPAEDAAALNAWKPDGQSFADPAHAPRWMVMIDERDAARAHQAFVQSLQAKYTALRTDPASYVLGVAPDIAQKFSDAMKDPKAIPAAMAALDGAFDRLGIPKANRPLLPADVARGLAAQITANPEQAPARLKQAQVQFGAYWPRVFGDLVSAGKLPPTFQAVATMDNEADASLLSRWIAQVPSGKTAADLLGDKTAATIKNSVRADPGVQALIASLTDSGSSVSQAQGVYSAIDGLAYAKAFFGHDPQAAQNAARSFTDKYEFMPDGGARVPKDRYDDVRTNAETVLQNLSLDNLSVPEIYGRPGMPGKDEFLDLVKASPTWITSPNADALWLKDPYGRIVRDKKGAPVAVPFRAGAAPQSFSGSILEGYEGGAGQ